jgi:hypothetical protein
MQPTAGAMLPEGWENDDRIVLGIMLAIFVVAGFLAAFVWHWLRREFLKTAGPNCKVCGQLMAQRVAPGTIVLHGPVATWSVSLNYQKQLLCLRCNPTACFVEGCHRPASVVLPHKFFIGIGQAAAAMRNDTCLCRAMVSNAIDSWSAPSHGRAF